MLILKASKIHGVGVFTTAAIRKGQRIPLFKYSDYKFRRKVKGYQWRYSIKHDGGWSGPADFHRMSIGWYLNHAKQHNVAMSGMTAKATRYIKAGQELTVNYEQL